MPRAADTLTDLLCAAAQAEDAELYRFCPSPEAEPERWSWRGLDRAARAWATLIAERCPVDAPVLVLSSFGRAFPLGFFACLAARRVAVPALCPDEAKSSFAIERLRHIIADARPALVLGAAPLDEDALARVPELRALPYLALDGALDGADELDARATSWRRPEGLREAPAFVQYTSGSTRAPRGVVITHANLFEHQARAHEVFGSPPGSTTVSWLPFHHDMGLIGAMLYPLYSRGRGVFMPPASFLRRPGWWLQMVSEMRARTSCAPNFAYQSCAAKARDEEIAKLDLSAWKITVCGAEPVRASTMRAFCDRFAPAGFRPETFLPCFGLAEATLVGTASAVAQRPRVARFDTAELRRGRVRILDAEDPCPAESHVGCGRPTRGHELRIVHPRTLEARAPGELGEIWLRGPSMAQTYWGDETLSREQLRAQLDEETTGADAGWMRSGDVGALVDGELFVFGRLDDFIEIESAEGSQWWPPDRFEAAVESARLAKELRGCTGGPVAFVPARGEHAGELTVAVETRRIDDPAAADTLAAAVAEAIELRTGVRPQRVLLIAPRTIAKTSSGKLRRFRYRETDARGELPLRHAWRDPTRSSSAA